MFRFRIVQLLFVCLLCANARAQAPQPAKVYLLHLPGIGGHMRIDDVLTGALDQSFRAAGVQPEYRIYNWTNGNPGLPALAAYNRNQLEAQRISDLIAGLVRADASRRVIVTCHSGGAGLAAWALEKLPEDVQIDTLLFLAPALSPEYDLSKALARVRGRAYAFSSTFDPVLGFGTRSFGTIDRVNTEAAGFGGFRAPAKADAEQYAKLLAIPYDRAWERFGNAGDHIGTMTRPFAQRMLAPLLLTGELPQALPTTRRATSRPAAVAN